MILKDKLKKIYEHSVLKYPKVIILSLLLITLFFAFQIPHFRLDASSESLSLENDQALKYYRQISKQYGSDNFLLITYTPIKKIFTPDALSDLNELQKQIENVKSVESVISILNVPLINSPPIDLQELEEIVPNLLHPRTNIALAQQELLNSPIYKDLIISHNGKTIALLVNFKPNTELLNIIKKREEIAPLKDKKVEEQYRIENSHAQKREDINIKTIRNIVSNYNDTAQIYLGGVPMIVTDSISYIRKDLITFGSAIFIFLIILLSLIFKKTQWVVIPMITCLTVGIIVTGFLGFVNWPVTIVSANFISLLLIFTLSFCVHQIVRYQEFQCEFPFADQSKLVRKMVFDIVKPCFFMAFTTAIGFASLIISDIRPIIDFGWLMTVGLGFSFVVSFVLLPACLMLLPAYKVKEKNDVTRHITNFFLILIQSKEKYILLFFALFLAFNIWGISQLNVQNRFIDYYKKDTEIYQGMEIIDKKLGGTTPLDIIIDAPQEFLDYQKEERQDLIESGFIDKNDKPTIIDGYWFGGTTLDIISSIHSYLDDLPETGKVLSFHTAALMLQDLDEKQLMDRMYLAILNNKLPEDVKKTLFYPYISKDGNQLRFSVRVFESQGGLNRTKMLNKIQTDLSQKFQINQSEIHFTGMLVLYNNLLETLFQSQILTVGTVFIVMFGIFIFLFRNTKIAIIAITPNITIVAIVLGTMGWLGIPLDIMTITIAAICFGAADDDTLHYIHRFMEEYKINPNYWTAIKKSHNTIGRAMYYTTITVMFGFSILAFSNFVPTIYFGLLTGFAMLVALIADLTLLPLLIVLFKPLSYKNYPL